VCACVVFASSEVRTAVNSDVTINIGNKSVAKITINNAVNLFF